jgi:hypothetical protein
VSQRWLWQRSLDLEEAWSINRPHLRGLWRRSWGGVERIHATSAQNPAAGRVRCRDGTLGYSMDTRAPS